MFANALLQEGELRLVLRKYRISLLSKPFISTYLPSFFKGLGGDQLETILLI